MVEGMIGAAVLMIAFATGFKIGQKERGKSRPQVEKTAEEIKRDRNFKRFMSYNGSDSLKK